MQLAIEKSLSTSLRECTSAAHTDAEQSPFMSLLLEGKLSREAAAAYTGQLWFIYSALEQGVRAVSQRPFMSLITDVRLERLESLEHDLVELLGASWRDELQAYPGTVEYVHRLNRLAAAEDDLGLIAHHYVRYLGDLAGGQVIARILNRSYGIGEQGLSFYDFSGIGKIKPYRDDYRSRLDALELNGRQVAHLIAEANRAFALNQGAFRDLAEHYVPASKL
ncbi:Heme oxygenase [Corynebacterium occultum]|uniref:heme oxygenase (biliverdin-producing) n=1 Tax=Corynebacterium occultum TaxID=2675219 RepID=A0A6B8W3W8_9CORY|nr:biliverdin-producing heme oxygenase [Corynebacterium occultum]QGU06105.1 Heme oxygenase [Corynebacterium occultum]